MSWKCWFEGNVDSPEKSVFFLFLHVNNPVSKSKFGFFNISRGACHLKYNKKLITYLAEICKMCNFWTVHN